MKIRKIITGIVLTIASVLTMGVLASCGGGNASSNEKPQTSSSSTENETSPFASLSFSKENVYLTSIGQGDFSTANQLFKRALGEDNFIADSVLDIATIPDGATVFVVIGSSGKGLGNASTDITKEEARAAALAEKKNNVNIVALHLGGAERRGETSDPSIRTVAGASKAVLVVEGGNNDGLFNTICGTTIPMKTYDKASSMLSDLTGLFAD